MDKIKYTLEDVGCYVDGARGIHAWQAIETFAQAHGFVAGRYDPADYEAHDWIEDDATDYMNEEFPVEGAYWGRSDQSDWGLWAVEEDAQ